MTASFRDWYGQGERLAQAQDYLKALRCFHEAAVLAPANLDVRVYQAICWVHLNRPQMALAVTDSILSQAPDHVQGWLFRGVALHRLGRYAEAYASYERALGRPSEPRLVARLRHWLRDVFRTNIRTNN